jgi:ubiquitin fusion degradation protein 1
MSAPLMISGPRIITNESLADDGRKVPAALVLPEGKFFFGFKYVPFDPSKAPKKATEAEPKAVDPFGGAGNSLKRRRGDNTPEVKAEVEKEETEPSADPWAKLGSGNTLRNQKNSAQTSTNASSRADSRQMTREEVIESTYLDEDDFGVEEDFDYGDDVIEIDSD